MTVARRLLLLAALWLTGCAGLPPLQAGASRAEVLTRWGKPTAAVPLPGGGERLQYSGQPEAPYAWMLDFDAEGRLGAPPRQALTPDGFARIGIGSWTRADLLREFGPPAQVARVASWAGPILVWRFTEFPNTPPRLFNVYLDAQGVVRRAHPSDDLRLGLIPRI